LWIVRVATGHRPCAAANDQPDHLRHRGAWASGSSPCRRRARTGSGCSGSR